MDYFALQCTLGFLVLCLEVGIANRSKATIGIGLLDPDRFGFAAANNPGSRVDVIRHKEASGLQEPNRLVSSTVDWIRLALVSCLVRQERLYWIPP